MKVNVFVAGLLLGTALGFSVQAMEDYEDKGNGFSKAQSVKKLSVKECIDIFYKKPEKLTWENLLAEAEQDNSKIQELETYFYAQKFLSDNFKKTYFPKHSDTDKTIKTAVAFFGQKDKRDAALKIIKSKPSVQQNNINHNPIPVWDANENFPVWNGNVNHNPISPPVLNEDDNANQITPIQSQMLNLNVNVEPQDPTPPIPIIPLVDLNVTNDPGGNPMSPMSQSITKQDSIWDFDDKYIEMLEYKYSKDIGLTKNDIKNYMNSFNGMYNPDLGRNIKSINEMLTDLKYLTIEHGDPTKIKQIEDDLKISLDEIKKSQ